MFAVMHKTTEIRQCGNQHNNGANNGGNGDTCIHLHNRRWYCHFGMGCHIEDVTQHQRDNRHGNLGNFSQNGKAKCRRGDKNDTASRH